MDGSTPGTQARDYSGRHIVPRPDNLISTFVTKCDVTGYAPVRQQYTTARGPMSKRKQLFVLVVSSDRVIAATLATVAQADGYLAATTPATATATRIAERMIVDAAVIDLPANHAISLDAAAAIQSAYPNCRIVLVCSSAQLDEAAMRAEECGLECEYLVRPLSRTELLARLAAAPGVPGKTQPWAGQLQAA